MTMFGTTTSGTRRKPSARMGLSGSVGLSRSRGLPFLSLSVSSQLRPSSFVITFDVAAKA